MAVITVHKFEGVQCLLSGNMNSVQQPDSSNSSSAAPDRYSIVAALCFLRIVIGWIMFGLASTDQKHPGSHPDFAVASTSANSGGTLSNEQNWRRRFAATPSQTAE